MRSIETNANLSPWRDRTIETCVLVAGLMACALAIPTPLAGLSVLAVCLALTAIAEVPPAGYLRKLLGAGAFAAVSGLPLAIAVSFHPRLSVDFDGIGAPIALLAATRALGTLSATLLLAHTTPFPRLLDLAERLRLPAPMVELLSLVHREIFQLDERMAKLRRALACRNGWRRGAARRSISLAAGALLVGALQNSRRRELALASRGGMDIAARRWNPPFQVRPTALALALAVPAATAAWIRWGGARLGF